MEKEVLEEDSVREPNLKLISAELDQAQADANQYIDRLERCRQWWGCLWKGQTFDGKKHGQGEEEVVLPWEGASDSKLRIVDTFIDYHVTICKAAFWGAELASKSSRPLIYGRMAKVAETVLKWQVYTQMRRELARELWHFYCWKFGFGLTFMGIEWLQERQKTYEQITVEKLIEAAQKLGIPQVQDLESEDAIEFLHKLSPIMSKEDARRVARELRDDGVSKFPVVNLITNRPQWNAKLPCVDVLIPSETWEIQASRFVNYRELVTTTQLEDRIETDEYDPDFVEEAKKHKGEFAEWLSQPGWRYNSQGSERDLIELQHFMARVNDDGVPAIYRTVFNQAVAGKFPALCASHKLFEYQHGLYPLVPGRRTYDFRPLLTSMGLAEEAYTDEMDIKAQQDGLNDRTDLINSPPMVVPTLRAQGIKSQYGPRAMMPTLRPQDVQWPPLPPSDNTPVAVIEMVYKRMRERYAIVGEEVDPQMKMMRLQEIAQDCHGEIELMLDQTLKLDQQFLDDEEVQRIAGDPQKPWNVSVADIQGDHDTTLTMDMRLSDMEYVTKKVALFKEALGMNQAGTGKMNKIFGRIMSIVDPDAEDLVEEDAQDASGREIDEEDQAALAILGGIEPRFPQFGNHQLRKQRLIEQTINNKDPEVQRKIATDKMVQQRLKSRLKNHDNQIQQYQVNPQIGRSVTTSATNPRQPAEMQQE